VGGEFAGLEDEAVACGDGGGHLGDGGVDGVVPG